jgi:hypothetical protein
MEGPTKAAEGLSVVHMNGGRNMLNNSGTITLRRKSAKRTEPWYNNLTSPATKKPRFETAMATATATAKGATKTASHDVAMTLSPPANADDDANNDPKPRATSTGATYTGRWTPEEDAILTHAVTNTYKKQYGKEWKIDWVAIIPLIPGRTKTQCQNRWQNALSRRIDRTAGRSGVWTEAEDLHLKDAVHVHGAKKWGAVAVLVPGRTKTQCLNRWHSFLNPSIIRRLLSPEGYCTYAGGLDGRRRQQAEGCGTHARCQGLGCNRRAGSESHDKPVQW